MQKISNELKTTRPQVVYNDLNTTADVRHAPRDSRVVRNKKTTDRRREKLAIGRPMCSNFADEYPSGRIQDDVHRRFQPSGDRLMRQCPEHYRVQ